MDYYKKYLKYKKKYFKLKALNSLSDKYDILNNDATNPTIFKSIEGKLENSLIYNDDEKYFLKKIIQLIKEGKIKKYQVRDKPISTEIELQFNTSVANNGGCIKPRLFFEVVDVLPIFRVCSHNLENNTESLDFCMSGEWWSLKNPNNVWTEDFYEDYVVCPNWGSTKDLLIEGKLLPSTESGKPPIICICPGAEADCMNIPPKNVYKNLDKSKEPQVYLPKRSKDSFRPKIEIEKVYRSKLKFEQVGKDGIVPN